MSKSKFLLLTFILGVFIALATGLYNAIRIPDVKRTEINLENKNAADQEIRIAFLTDTHAAEPGSSSKRITSIVEQINSEKPDLVLLGGDFVSTKQLSWNKPGFEEAIAPFSKFDAPMGVYAVMGNHDHWKNAEQGRRALKRAKVTVLDNDAVQIGPIALGGVDDAFTHHANTAGTIMKMNRLSGAKVLLSHSPDVVPEVPDTVGLILAGHTHCGQVSLPFIGPLVTMSKYGQKYACGIIKENGKTIITSAGTGTSLLPLRFGAPPDIWIITAKMK